MKCGRQPFWSNSRTVWTQWAAYPGTSASCLSSPMYSFGGTHFTRSHVMPRASVLLRMSFKFFHDDQSFENLI